MVVNAGVDPAGSAVAGRLGRVADRAGWHALLADDAVLVDRAFAGRRYGSTSTSLVELGADGVRYAFNPRPRDPSGWYEVAVGDAGGA